MAVKTKAPAKKATAKAAVKKVTVKKAPAREASPKAAKFVCGTCGLTITVDEWGDVAVGEIICCEKPMKAGK
jgi:hypothetical protein